MEKPIVSYQNDVRYIYHATPSLIATESYDPVEAVSRFHKFPAYYDVRGLIERLVEQGFKWWGVCDLCRKDGACAGHVSAL